MDTVPEEMFVGASYCVDNRIQPIENTQPGSRFGVIDTLRLPQHLLAEEALDNAVQPCTFSRCQRLLKLSFMSRNV